MSIIAALIVLTIVGVVVSLITTMIPMDQAFKTLIYVVVILGVCGWLLEAVGIFGGHVTIR